MMKKMSKVAHVLIEIFLELYCISSQVLWSEVLFADFPAWLTNLLAPNFGMAGNDCPHETAN